MVIFFFVLFRNPVVSLNLFGLFILIFAFFQILGYLSQNVSFMTNYTIIVFNIDQTVCQCQYHLIQQRLIYCTISRKVIKQHSQRLTLPYIEYFLQMLFYLHVFCIKIVKLNVYSQIIFTIVDKPLSNNANGVSPKKTFNTVCCSFICYVITFGQRHAKRDLRTYAKSVDPDQPPRLRRRVWSGSALFDNHNINGTYCSYYVNG